MPEDIDQIAAGTPEDPNGPVGDYGSYEFIKTYIEATQHEDHAEVEEDDFWNELAEVGLKRENIAASYADADQDGYTVTVKVRAPLPPQAAHLRVDTTGAEFDKWHEDMGQWPELYT